MIIKYFELRERREKREEKGDLSGVGGSYRRGWSVAGTAR